MKSKFPKIVYQDLYDLILAYLSRCTFCSLLAFCALAKLILSQILKTSCSLSPLVFTRGLLFAWMTTMPPAWFSPNVTFSEWLSLAPPMQIRCLGFVLPLNLLFTFMAAIAHFHRCIFKSTFLLILDPLAVSLAEH